MRPAIPAVLLLACAFPASAVDPPAGVIRVTAAYPGADARTVDETVLRPLFQQINGVEGAIRIESEARDGGTGTLTVYFEPKTDLNLAQMMVQNRANIALPMLPEPCRQLGVSVRKFPAGPPAFWLALTSVDDKHDAAFLGTYALVQLKAELARVPGVADVRVVGSGNPSLRVWLKPDRLAAYRLTARDVVGMLRRENIVGAAGVLGGLGLQYTVTASGRLTSVEEFSKLILRANPEGEVLRLKDVARVELGAEKDGFARVNGKPAALIAVTAWPGRVTAAQLRKIEAASDLPPGIRFDIVADRTAGRLLEVELRLPPGSSREWTKAKAEHATKLIRRLPGEPGTVALLESHSSGAATIFVRLPAKGGPTAADVERALAEIPGTAIRVGTVSPGGEAFPIRLALTDPGEGGDQRLDEVKNLVIAGLKTDPGVANLAAFPGPAVPKYTVDINRDQCAMRGVELPEVFTTLQATLGGIHATDFSKFGRSWRVMVRAAPEFTRTIADLEHLFVRNDRGEMVPLSVLATARKTQAPAAVVRVNGYRAIIVTAAPVAGHTPAEVAARCVKLARKGLPKGYRVTDLTGLPR